MDNPMRDVIEQMKATAQQEGKMQTSPVAKAAQERRRLIEYLSSAKMFAKRLHGSLVDADLWANDEQAPTVRALYEQAEQLQKQIVALLQEQGE